MLGASSDEGCKVYDVLHAHTNDAARVATGRVVENLNQLTLVGSVLLPAGVFSTA